MVVNGNSEVNSTPTPWRLREPCFGLFVLHGFSFVCWLFDVGVPPRGGYLSEVICLHRFTKITVSKFAQSKGLRANSCK